jgi:Coiled-coil protein 142
LTDSALKNYRYSPIQTISKHRAEQCCLALITCLLNTCKPDANAQPSDSETSSLEILKTLTTHLLPAESLPTIGITKGPYPRNPPNCMELHVSHPGPTLSESDFNDSTSKFFDNMAKETVDQVMGTINYLVSDDNDQLDQLEELIAEEEIYIANILLKCVQLCPSAFDGKIGKEELAKAMEKGSRNLWTQIGGKLEQLVVWWSSSPLCCRPVNCAKYLRDWLMLLVQADAPEPIYSTLKGLGESLTVYVTNTMWDKQFRLCLVSSSLPVDYPYEESEFLVKADDPSYVANPGCVPGRLWRDLLSGIVAISNTCDRIGTIPNELPIVEQIPVLHRLDHSIHTMRLWAQRLAKSLCSDWNMKMFFRVVEKDIGICLEQLKELRTPQLATPDALEVHVQVNVALRAKLVSEIKVNIEKLKLTSQECINILAAICRTTSLATFSLCFPSVKQWQCNYLQEKANDYVAYFLQQIFLSVLEATHDLEILKLCLKIICEAWLDHIYMKKVKFSYCGALNLLKDFDGVAEWINQCPAITEDQHRAQLAKHEVLRMCEGVGRILLRKPDEVISMLPSPKHFKRGENNGLLRGSRGVKNRVDRFLVFLESV